MCHPGDKEWDAPDESRSTPKSDRRRGPGEAELAARLLESKDQSINECFLWQGTDQTVSAILEKGIYFPDATEKNIQAPNRIFYETAIGCLNTASTGTPRTSEQHDGSRFL